MCRCIVRTPATLILDNCEGVVGFACIEAVAIRLIVRCRCKVGEVSNQFFRANWNRFLTDSKGGTSIVARAEGLSETRDLWRPEYQQEQKACKEDRKSNWVQNGGSHCCDRVGQCFLGIGIWIAK